VPNAGYGRFNFSTLPGAGNATVKWNCVFRENNVPAGAHSYTCYVVVGTLQDVRAGLVALRAALTGGRPAPLPADPAPASQAATALPAARAPGVALYVGTEQGCNAGEVTIDPGYKGCATAPIGATLAQQTSPADAPVYAGTAAGLDAGLVTNNPRHLDAGTRPIGYLAAAGAAGRRSMSACRAAAMPGWSRPIRPISIAAAPRWGLPCGNASRGRRPGDRIRDGAGFRRSPVRRRSRARRGAVLSPS
jgi:hypothetical protein